MTNLENRFHQFQVGYLDINSWEGSRETLSKTLSIDHFQYLRKSIGAATRWLEFLNLIDDLAKENE